MKKSIYLVILTVISYSVVANPGQFQINQACIDVGCFSGDNPATSTIEITKSSGTFVLTSNITVADNGSPAITVSTVDNNSAITIDLNGYQIKHSAVADSNTNGIEVSGQNSVVTIKNGKVAAFYDGIHVLSGTTVVIENMVFRINRDDAIQAGKGIIRNNVFDENNFAINATNPSATLAGDRLYVSNNLFTDDDGDQDTTFSFANSNYCKDNVIAYTDAGSFGACTLVGTNLCDTASCVSNGINSASQKE